MAQIYDEIAIIYNPNSTGNAPRIAERLAAKLGRLDIAKKVSLLPTQRAGHAEELAKTIATEVKRPLIVSVSGDGGYHEVINGVLAAKNSQAVVTVEGAGNANDHWRTVHGNKPLAKRMAGKPYKISLLKLTTSNAALPQRYAHSYIGLGISAKVANDLNQQDLNVFNEKLLLAKAIFKSKAFRIRSGKRVERLDNYIAANIHQMAKVLKLEKQLTVTAGDFTITKHPHDSPWRRIGALIGIAVMAQPQPTRTKRVRFTLLSPVWIQCDGEPQPLPAGTRITIESAPKALLTI